MERRKFLSLAINGAGPAAAGTVAVPALLDALTPAIQKESKEETWRPLGELANFEVGKIQEAVVQLSDDPATLTVARRSVYVWRPAPESVVVYSRSCTDLGCPINWDPGSEWFYCPCHGGIFSKEGERRAGPPKKPLWRYATRERDGILEIDLRSVPPMA